MVLDRLSNAHHALPPCKSLLQKTPLDTRRGHNNREQWRCGMRLNLVITPHNLPFFLGSSLVVSRTCVGS